MQSNIILQFKPCIKLFNNIVCMCKDLFLRELQINRAIDDESGMFFFFFFLYFPHISFIVAPY